GGQMLQFPTGDKLMHELPSLVGNGKAELAITRQKACRTQYAQGILDKGYRNMTQHPGLQIFESPIGVDEFALPVLGHRVDSEVATRQVLLQGNVGAGMNDEAGIPMAGLALGTRQSVLFMGVGM